MQVAASKDGHACDNMASGIVAEYNSRRLLAELGYTSPLSELSADKAHQFILVAAAYAK